MPKKAKAKKTAGARKSPGVAKKKARAGKATARKTANRKTTKKKAPRAESVNRAAEARRKRSLEAVGLYEKALKGEIANFTGVSDPYEAPLTPEVLVNTEIETVEESLGKVVAALEERGFIPQGLSTRLAVAAV